MCNHDHLALWEKSLCHLDFNYICIFLHVIASHGPSICCQDLRLLFHQDSSIILPSHPTMKPHGHASSPSCHLHIRSVHFTAPCRAHIAFVVFGVMSALCLCSDWLPVFTRRQLYPLHGYHSVLLPQAGSDSLFKHTDYLLINEARSCFHECIVTVADPHWVIEICILLITLHLRISTSSSCTWIISTLHRTSYTVIILALLCHYSMLTTIQCCVNL